MNKQLKVLASALTVLMVSTALVGCGTSGSSTTEKKELVIWSQYQGPDLKPIKKVADDWAKKTGNKVKVVEDKAGFDSLVTAVKSSKGPDVEIGVAQDHLGSFVKAKIIDKVPDGTIDTSKYLDPAVQAATYNGDVWGVPVTLETYGLFYNKDLVPEAPKTYEDMVKIGKEKGLKWELNNFYFSYAVLAGNGAYVFKNNNGTLDVKDIGLDKPEAIAGFKALKELVDDKIISSSDNGDVVKGLFQNKKIGLYVSGPWDVKTMTDAGVNFGVVPYPQIGGKPTPTFATVKMNFVSATSKNKTLAWDFMKYAAEKMPMELFNTQKAIPALKADADSDTVKKDPITAAFAEQAKVCYPMPNVPEFGTVWEPAKNNVTLMITGKQSPEDTGKNLVKQVTDKITEMDK